MELKYEQQRNAELIANKRAAEKDQLLKLMFNLNYRKIYLLLLLNLKILNSCLFIVIVSAFGDRT